jgi:hypothetical protein
MRPRPGGLAAFVTLACIAVVGVGAAWACTGQPLMHLATDAVGEAGSHARVEVLANQAVSGPVAVRWNALDGPVLAQADLAPGTAATLDVTIPQTAPGVYYLVLDTSAGVARSAFEVTDPMEAPASPASPWAATSAAGDDAPFGSFRAGVALLAVGIVAMSAITLVALARRRTAARPSA